MSLRTTVIIAHRNYQQYLDDAIKSCLNQSIKPDKIVVVDDNSDDKEALFAVLKKNEGPTLHTLLLHNTSGPSTARNHAIDYALQDTDIFFILDADDMMYPNKIEECLKVFEISNAIGVVYANYSIYDVHKGTTISHYKEPFSQRRLMEECIVHSGAAITREALLKVKDEFGYYDCQMRTCEDFDLWIRISDYFMIHHIPKLLTMVRNHNSNSTQTVDRSIWEQNWHRIAQKRDAKQNR